MPKAPWFFSMGTDEKLAHFHHPYLQFCLQQIKSRQSPCSNKDIAKAYNAAYGEELAYYPTLFERRPDGLPMHVSDMPQPMLVELLTAWLREKQLTDIVGRKPSF